jgi:hypothetical protein
MKKPKLTPAQQKVVDAMKAGNKLRYMGGLHAHCWLNTTGSPSVTNTAFALERMGVIKRVNQKAAGCEFELTEEWK